MKGLMLPFMWNVFVQTIGRNLPAKGSSNATTFPKLKEEEEINSAILFTKLKCMQNLVYEVMEGKLKNKRKALTIGNLTQLKNSV